MKLIIQNNNGDEVYKREFEENELNSFVTCKDCKHFYQHYGLSDVPMKPMYMVESEDKVRFLHKINAGHCAGTGRIKNIVPDGRVCKCFVLNEDRFDL